MARGGVEPPTFRFKIDVSGDRRTPLDALGYVHRCCAGPLLIPRSLAAVHGWIMGVNEGFNAGLTWTAVALPCTRLPAGEDRVGDAQPLPTS